MSKESTNQATKTITLPVVTEAPAVTVSDCVLSIFKADPVREFKTDDVVLEVQKHFPAQKRDSILTHIAALKKNGTIQKVRQEGTTHILRLASAAPAVSAPTLSTAVSQPVIASETESPADLGTALVNLSQLLEKAAKLDQEISLMKSIVRRMVAA